MAFPLLNGMMRMARRVSALLGIVAIVDAAACTACGDCLTVCPYAAITMAEEGDRHFAAISPTACKGCGACVPICPENAIDLLGYTDAEVTAMIELDLNLREVKTLARSLHLFDAVAGPQ